MPTLKAIQQRLTQLAEQQNPIVQSVISQLTQKQFHACLDAKFVASLCQQFNKTSVELALACLPIAACYARTPVSHFYVGAIVIGQSGHFYFGANQEFEGESMAQTIHAEQSAISHAWLAGETAISDVIVNYTPCGHCRQFMNELNTANTLKIHLPHSQKNALHSYLPDAFGPKDLHIEKVLFDKQPLAFVSEMERPTDDVSQKAIEAAQQSYAPYSGSFSGVALLLANQQIVCGRYAENAAFNPSLPPLQLALNYQRMLGLADENVLRAVVAERANTISHKSSTEAMVNTLLNLPLEYIAL